MSDKKYIYKSLHLIKCSTAFFIDDLHEMGPKKKEKIKSLRKLRRNVTG